MEEGSQTANNLESNHTKELVLDGKSSFSPVAVPHTSVSSTLKKQMYNYTQKLGAATVWKHP